MKKEALISFPLIALILLAVFTLKADIFDDIALAIESGNSREVSKFFSSQVELRIIDKEDVYSKTQAEIILKEFFVNHKPQQFKIIHRGSSKKGTRYAIGKLSTGNGTFRTYFFIKKIGKRSYIQELRIEKD